ncbi:hypothetical protein [Synechococcus sp. CBW1006]|uniref:hypothetical protein n=1 Tax=Synechococcus sp. CBW1006 TaxID=1353138 RepID=UPI00351C732E
MTRTSSPAPAHADSAASFNALAPLRLPADLRLTPEQFERVCAEKREAVLELAKDGRVIAMAPTGSWKVFESPGGFRLPDGSVVSPAASL